jgi:gas vesicle protein
MMRFLLGLGLGTFIGMVIAPAPGEHTRRMIRQKGEEELADVIQMGRENAGDLGCQAGQKAFDEAAKRVAGQNIVDLSRGA